MLASNRLKEWKDKLTQYILPITASKNIKDDPVGVFTFLSPETLKIRLKPSLLDWIRLYLERVTSGAPLKTHQAKKYDLGQFARFFVNLTGKDDLVAWTPAITRCFQETMTKNISAVTGRSYSYTTINRMVASLKHFAGWLQK